MNATENRQLYLFESGNPDWVVAFDEDDAIRLWCEQVGEAPNDYVGTCWVRLNDDDVQKFWLAPNGTITSPDSGDGAELVELKALDVVKKFGRGFVASVDF